MEKEGGCIFYHNTLRTLTANRYIFVAKFVPVLTTFCMVSLKFLELFCAFLLAFLGFSNAKDYAIFFGVVDSVVPK